MHRHIQDKGNICCIPHVNPLLNQRHCQKHLTWAKEKNNWSVNQWSKVLFQMELNFVFHLEIKVPGSRGSVERHRIQVASSPVWDFHRQWWFGEPCHLLVLVHCVLSSPKSTQSSTRKFQVTSCFLLLHGDADFNFPAGLGTCLHCQKYKYLV